MRGKTHFYRIYNIVKSDDMVHSVCISFEVREQKLTLCITIVQQILRNRTTTSSKSVSPKWRIYCLSTRIHDKQRLVNSSKQYRNNHAKTRIMQYERSRQSLSTRSRSQWSQQLVVRVHPNSNAQMRAMADRLQVARLVQWGCSTANTSSTRIAPGVSFALEARCFGKMEWNRPESRSG